MQTCKMCGNEIEQASTGRKRKFCAPCAVERHRQRVYRRRQAERRARERRNGRESVAKVLRRKSYSPHAERPLYDGLGRFLGWSVWDGTEWERTAR